MTRTKRTQVGIIGSGPAGLLLSHLLQQEGIETIILERQSREHVESRIRAGVLEQGTAWLLRQVGVSARMDREGLVHDGVNLAFGGEMRRIDFKEHTGKGVLVYGQTEMTKDLIQARLERGGAIEFNAPAKAVEDTNGQHPRILFEKDGEPGELVCDFVAGCDGSHGVSRQSAPAGQITQYEKVYPFGWLGIMADVPPVNDELIYINHPRGFALCSMRSPTRSRYYIQCSMSDKVENWNDEAFWEELRCRLPPPAADRLVTGPRLEMSITPLRGYVAEPMRFGKLFLAGDGAHIMPPTGAKGLNLAASDAFYLSRALIAFYKEKRTDLLDRYSDTALRRVWGSIRFSLWYTERLHKFDDNPFNQRIQVAELAYATSSEAASASFAENYVGLPFEKFE
jgi:p-hydroxybenzoate 3-monooxygenase